MGLSLKPAWYLDQRLREGFANSEDEPQTHLAMPMSGTVEVDEAYIGGMDRWKHVDKKLHEDWRSGREMVIGMKNRKTNQGTAKRIAGDDREMRNM